MNKLIRAIQIRVQVAIAKREWFGVNSCETLDIPEFYHELFGRVRDFLPSPYRLREFDLEQPGSFPTFPVWGGYLQNFGEILRTTESTDGKSKHNWYSLKNFRLGWFYTLEQDLFVFVLRGDRVHKYLFKM